MAVIEKTMVLCKKSTKICHMCVIFCHKSGNFQRIYSNPKAREGLKPVVKSVIWSGGWLQAIPDDSFPNSL